MERLNSRRLPLRWPEAVALVQELAEGLAEGELTSVPLVREIGVAEDGQIGLPRSRSELGSHPEPDLPANLRRLLGELLNGGAFPGALLGTMEGRLADGRPIETLEDLLRALAFFERPGRQNDLQALAARLAQENEQERLTAELGALTRRTRIDEAAPHPDSKPGNSTTAVLQRAILIAGICVTMLLLVGIVTRNPCGTEGAHRFGGQHAGERGACHRGGGGPCGPIRQQQRPQLACPGTDDEGSSTCEPEARAARAYSPACTASCAVGSANGECGTSEHCDTTGGDSRRTDTDSPPGRRRAARVLRSRGHDHRG